MSERRKKDRYNDTWTKEELTSSLKKSETSSHKSSRYKEDIDEDYYIKKERKRRDERDDSHKKSKSDRHRESSGRVKDSDDRKRRPKREGERENRDDRRKEDKNRDKYRKTNGEDSRHHRKDRDEEFREERTHRREKSSKDDREKRNLDRDEDQYKEKRERRRDEGDDRRRKKHENDYHERDVDGDKKRQSDDRSHRRHEKDRKRRDYEEEDDYLKKERREHRKKVDEDDEERRLRKERRRREKEAEYDHHKNKVRDREKESRNDKYDRSDKHSRKNHDDESRSNRDSYHHKKDNERHNGKKIEQSKHGSKKNMNSTYVVEDEKNSTNQEEDEYNYDDEEFEDYADDFEDDEDDNEENVGQKFNKPPNQMDELMRAIAAENERANSAQSSGKYHSMTTNSDRNDSPFSGSNDAESNREGSASSGIRNTSSTMINFSAAKSSSTNNKAKKRIIKRSKDLMSLIQLDSISFDILDMAPVTEYNLYIKNYGNSNTVQASVQCNDDNLDQEIQTEIPDMEEKWSQHPPHEIKCSGGVVSKFAETQAGDEDRARMLSTMRGDSKRLIKFMTRSCKLIESILIEDEMWETSGIKKKQKSQLSFCDSCVPLQTNLAYLQGRKVVHITTSSGTSENLIAVAFEPASTSFSTRIDRKGLVSVWDTRKPGIPEKILVCDACPTYCSFSSTKSYILFVGTDDGCVLAYDLREPGVYHQVVSLEKKRETILRSATYTTGYLDDGHSSPIVSIMSVGAESKFSDDSTTKDEQFKKSHSGLAFQLASLEEAANLCIWIVVELLPEAEANDDLGLAPHGKIKLIRSLNLKIYPAVKSAIPDLPFRTTCVQFSVIDPNNFFVGTDTGHIVHCTQYQATSESNESKKNKFTFFNEIDAISSVTSIDINPFQLFGASMILSGYDDGSIRLYLSDRELPVVSWPFSTEGSGIVKVQWSTSRPSVFFILDSSHNLHIWDLAIMHAGPIKTEQFHNKPIHHFALSNTPVTSATHSPEIALAYEETSSNDSSLVEVHKLAPHFSQVTDNNELDQLTFLLQSLL